MNTTVDTHTHTYTSLQQSFHLHVPRSFHFSIEQHSRASSRIRTMPSRLSNPIRPTSEQISTVVFHQWLSKLQQDVDTDYDGLERSYIAPELLTFNDGKQRTEWGGHQEDTMARGTFAEISRPRRTGGKSGRTRQAIGVVDSWNKKYPGIERPTMDRWKQNRDDWQQWNSADIGWHCWAFLLTTVVDENNKDISRGLVIFDCDQALGSINELKECRTQRIRYLVGWLRSEYKIDYVWIGNGGNRFFEQNKCVDATTQWAERMAQQPARPIKITAWNDDPRLRGFKKISMNGHRR